MASPALSSSPHTYPLNAATTAASPPGREHDLTTFFLNSKRSLDSKDYIVRAADLFQSTKAALEHAAVLLPKCVYLRNALESQLRVMHGLNSMMKQGKSSFVEYVQRTVKDYEEAKKGLDIILTGLRNTTLDAAFTPEHHEPRTLHDFLDENGVQKQLQEIQDIIARADESIQKYMNTLDNFDGDINDLETAIKKLPSKSPKEASILSPSQNPIPRAISLMDHRTVSLVDCFEKLNHHYEQCVDALRRTEAAPMQTSTARLMHSLSPEEFQVLESDAGAVDEVLQEMTHFVADMEQTYLEQVQGHIVALENCWADTNEVLARFEGFQGNLGNYLVANTEFESAQKEYQTLIHPALDRLAVLSDFYANFTRAYDEMIVEVGRRMGIRTKMEQIMNQALSQIEELYEHDLQKREEFKSVTGEYLPLDIWPGLIDPPMRYNVEAVGGDIPQLKNEVLSRALRTINGI